MLDLAGVDGGGFAVYSERYEKIGQNRVALVKAFGSPHAFFGQGDEAGSIHLNLFARLQNSNGAADARL